MNEERLAELLGSALNYIIKRNKIKEANLEEFLMDEIGVEDFELSDIYEYIEEMK